MRPQRHSDGEPTVSYRGREAELFRRHQHELVLMVQGRLSVPRELAEDACSLAWLQLLRRPPTHENVVGWLYLVAKREALALLYRYSREEEPEAGDEPMIETDGLDAVVAKQEARLIARLKPQQRLVLLLRGEGYSYSQIQTATGKSYTWVNRHLSEGRAALRRLIVETQEGGEDRVVSP
jgi:RNA polymerase sigma factor (sigma-70 family)